MNIFVELPDGTQVELPSVHPNCSVKDVKEMLSEAEGLHTDIELTYSDEILENDSSLFSYGITFGDHITAGLSKEQLLRHRIGINKVNHQVFSNSLMYGCDICLDFFELGYLSLGDAFIPDGPIHTLTPLHVLALSRHVSLMKQTLKRYKDVININKIRGLNPRGTVLYAACYSGSVEIVIMLLSISNVDVNAGCHNNNPLSLSIRKLNYEIVDILLSHPSIECLSVGYNSDLAVAIQTGEMRMVNRILSVPKIETTHSYVFACHFKKIDILKELVSVLKLPITTPTKGSSFPLQAAARSCNIEIFNFIAAREDVNFDQITDYGETATHAAAAAGFLYALEILIKKVNINRECHSGMTPLDHAVANEKWDAAALLLNSERIKIPRRCRLLHKCVESGHERSPSVFEVLELLLEKGSDPNLYSEQKKTPLFAACLYGNQNAVETLLSIPETDVNLRCHTDWSPLYISCVAEYKDIVELLLKNEYLNINQKTDTGFTALHLTASDQRFSSLFNLLIKDQRLSVLETDNDGLTAEQVAINSDNTEAAKVLSALRNRLERI